MIGIFSNLMPMGLSQWRQTLFFSTLGYLSGSFLSAYFLPLWLCHIDVTENADDHNPGAANAFMKAGIPCGILVLLCDLAKGMLPVFCAKEYLSPACPGFALVLIAPVIGHAWSCFYGGKGGKAIAVSFGVLLGLLPDFRPAILLAAFYIFFSVLVRIPSHSHRTIVTFSCWLITVVFLLRDPVLTLAGIGIAGIVIYKHRRAERLQQTEMEKSRPGTV